MRGLLIILLLCTYIAAAGQDDVELTIIKSDSAKGRDKYVQRYPNHFFVWPVIKQRSLSFDVEHQSGSKEKLTFKPNNSVSFGIGAYLFDVGMEFAFNVPLDDASRKRYGVSHVKDFQLNTLSRRFGLDLYTQQYNGFYRADSKLRIPKGDPLPQRPDIHTSNLGLSGFYIFRDKKFSIISAYNFAERQLKSHGSVLLVGALNSFKVKGDSSILPNYYSSGFGKGANFDQLKYTTFSIAPGYSYSVILKHYFLNTTLVLGPAHNWTYYHQVDGKDKHDITINTYSSIRIALGYNSDHFFGGVSFVSQARSVKFEEMRFTNSSNTFRIVAGYRFKEWGLLKRSVWDIPRELMKLIN